MKHPTIKDLAALLRALKSEIGDEYRAPGDEDSSVPSMQVTIGLDPGTGDWNWQTGDNSYTGGAYAYPHWAVIALYRRANCRELARDIIGQWLDLVEC